MRDVSWFLERTTSSERRTWRFLVSGGMVRASCSEHVSVDMNALRMHLIGWQNTWEQAPGVPATPSPP